MGIGIVSAGSQAESNGLFLGLHNPTSVIQGTWTLVYSGVLHAFLLTNTTTKANGDEINFKGYLSAGEYAVSIIYRQATDEGIIKIQIDGVTVLTQDAYNLASTYNNVSEDTFIQGSSGVVDINIKIDGKNGAASHHNSYIQALEIRRIA